jgi:hypothetical protein
LLGYFKLPFYGVCNSLDCAHAGRTFKKAQSSGPARLCFNIVVIILVILHKHLKERLRMGAGRAFIGRGFFF